MDDAYDDEGRVESGSRTGEVWADGGHRNGFIGVFVAEKAGVVLVDSVLPISKSSSESLSSSSSLPGAYEVWRGGGPLSSATACVALFPLELFAA